MCMFSTIAWGAVSLLRFTMTAYKACRTQLMSLEPHIPSVEFKVSL